MPCFPGKIRGSYILDTEIPSFFNSVVVSGIIILLFFFLDDTQAGIKMEIVFKRRLTNELLTTYLPTSLLLGITYATTFFKPFFFEAALTVNLTVMLVITTLFSNFANLVCTINAFSSVQPIGKF